MRLNPFTDEAITPIATPMAQARKDGLKILVVDDHALVREGLRQVLKGLGDQVEVLDAPNCATAFALADSHPDIDLVLLDFHLPDMDGLAALDVLRQTHPELPVVILSGTAEPQVMGRVLDKGAAGFITKSSVSDELLFALTQVLDGGIYVPWTLSGENTASLKVAVALPAAPTPATHPGSFRPAGQVHFQPRQDQVLRLLLEGQSNKEICRALGLSEETVKSHVKVIFRTLSVQTRTQAVLAATRLGYAVPPSL